jgi:GNAT superfamily N-acetyltransferase
MSSGFEAECRLAGMEDRDGARALIEESISVLLKPFLDAEQLEASREIMGLDTQLIEDKTFFVVEFGARLVACGGWSRRATQFGADHSAGRDYRLLDSRYEPARIRAMYTHPRWARRGIGRMVLSRSESAAVEAGFKTAHLTATVAGEPFYQACGYEVVERHVHITSSRVGVPIVLMSKNLMSSIAGARYV